MPIYYKFNNMNCMNFVSSMKLDFAPTLSKLPRSATVGILFMISENTTGELCVYM